jgi:alpha-D-ribose 1-methylphosphonate 5-triphosphate synthase subunit PhnG
MTEFDDVFAARSRWAVALNALPRETVLQVGADLARRHRIAPATVPQAGLALLSLRDSVEKQAFYLGDIPLASSRVTITDADGRTVEGGALIMADDAELASALAICDGVLAHRLSGWETVAETVREGLTNAGYEARVRKTMLSRSRVNFALLNEEDGFDDDDAG